MDLHERITKLRKSRGWSQQQVADVLGITRGAYANYEVGTRGIDSGTVTKLADIYDISADYLLGRDSPDDTHSSAYTDEIDPETEELLRTIKELSEHANVQNIMPRITTQKMLKSHLESYKAILLDIIENNKNRHHRE